MPVALLLLAGCAAPAEPAKAVVADVPPASTPLPPEEKARGAGAERWYEMALGFFNKGDFDKAREFARKAVQADPENLAARKLLDDIHSVIVGAPARHDVRDRMVAVEQAQIEIAKHLADARRYRGAGMEASARREYQTAELKIRALPYDVPALRDLLPEIRAAFAR